MPNFPKMVPSRTPGSPDRDDLCVQIPDRLVRHPRIGADHLLQHGIELAVVHGELDAGKQHSVVEDFRRAADDAGIDAAKIEVMGNGACDSDPLVVHEDRHEERDIVEVLAPVVRIVVITRSPGSQVCRGCFSITNRSAVPSAATSIGICSDWVTDLPWRSKRLVAKSFASRTMLE